MSDSQKTHIIKLKLYGVTAVFAVDEIHLNDSNKRNEVHWDFGDIGGTLGVVIRAIFKSFLGIRQ